MKTVFFADLTHTAQGIHAKCMPLGAGLIAAHIQKEFQSSLDVELFKMPADLEKAVLERCPDVLCLSNYAWNFRLAGAFAKLIKEINPNLVVIHGGPNFPLKEHERKDFLIDNDHIDFYVFGEGEIALANLLQEVISSDFDISAIKATERKLINCSYLTNDRLRVISGEWTRTVDLDKFPCPYEEGLMDTFFEMPLIPLYETTRGCPFSCTFCTDGINEKSGIFRKSQENIQKSLRSIYGKIKHSDTLILADLNFGMYKEDVETAISIAKHQKETGYPTCVGTALGKSKPERIMQVVKILDGSLHIGLSFQSTDPEILQNIKRKNVPTDKLIAAASDIGLRDSVDFTEMILCLPGDTLEKHYRTLREGVDLGMTNIRMYQLMLLVGSEMNTPESRRKYGMTTKWRVMPNCAGVYQVFGKELRVAEIEEIVVANNTMSFDDYLECRVMDFIVELIVNNDWYVELFELIKLHDLKVFDLLLFIKENRAQFPRRMAEIFDSYVRDTCKDLFDKKEDIEAFVLGENILERHVSGELGNNEILDHKAMCYSALEETTQFIFEMARVFLTARDVMDEAVSLYLTDLEKFVVCRKGNVLNVESDLVGQFNFDLELLSSQNFRVDPHDLEVENRTYRFFHDDRQATAIKKAAKLYGTSVSGMGRFIQNNKMNRMFRHFEHLNSSKPYPSRHVAPALLGRESIASLAGVSV